MTFRKHKRGRMTTTSVRAVRRSRPCGIAWGALWILWWMAARPDFAATAFPAPKVGRGGDLPTVTGLAEVNGTTLYYEMRGSGPDVVLIEGGNLDHQMWDDQFREFSAHARVIRYDVRGFGRSGSTGAPYLAHEDLHALLRYLGIGRASLVGLSLGGRIAIDFALEHPDRVEALVLAGPGLSGFAWSTRDETWTGPIRKAVEAGDAAGAVEGWLRSPYMAPAMEDPRLAPRLRRLAKDNRKSWLQKDSEIELSPPAAGRLSQIRAPTLLIVGSRDIPDIQRIVDTLAREIAGAEKVVFTGAGHMVNLEQPERFSAKVLSFLARVGKRLGEPRRDRPRRPGC